MKKKDVKKPVLSEEQVKVVLGGCFDCGWKRGIRTYKQGEEVKAMIRCRAQGNGGGWRSPNPVGISPSECDVRKIAIARVRSEAVLLSRNLPPES